MAGDYEDQELPQLCAELRKRGLVSSGARHELVQRLLDHDRLAERRGARRPAQEEPEQEQDLSHVFGLFDDGLEGGAPLSPDDDSMLLGAAIGEDEEGPYVIDYGEACPVAGSDDYFLAEEELLGEDDAEGYEQDEYFDQDDAEAGEQGEDFDCEAEGLADSQGDCAEELGAETHEEAAAREEADARGEAIAAWLRRCAASEASPAAAVASPLASCLRLWAALCTAGEAEGSAEEAPGSGQEASPAGGLPGPPPEAVQGGAVQVSAAAPLAAAFAELPEASPPPPAPAPAPASAPAPPLARRPPRPRPARLTPRLQCLRDLARASCEELGVPYASLVMRLRGRVEASGPVRSSRIAFRVRDRLPVPPPAPSKPSRPPRLAAARAALPPFPAVVVVDEDGEPGTEAPAAAPAPAGADAGAGGSAVPPGAADPYASRTAPLVLLRTYLSQDRWVGMRQGYVVFEDDGVQYPAATLAPVWERPAGGALLSLASLWLLGTLRGRYEASATPSVLQRHGAAKVVASHAQGLLDYLLGRRGQCELVVAVERLYAVPAPAALRLSRPNTAAPGARLPLAPSDLRSLPSESPRLEPCAAEGIKRLQKQVTERARARAEVDGFQLVEGLQAVSKVQMSLRRLETEEKALAKLREELQARLHAADRRLLKAGKRRQQLHEEYRSHLAKLHAAAKRRRLSAGAGRGAAAAGAEGAAGGGRAEKRAPRSEDLLAQLLTALEAGTPQTPKPYESVDSVE